MTFRQIHRMVTFDIDEWFCRRYSDKPANDFVAPKLHQFVGGTAVVFSLKVQQPEVGW